MKERKLEEVRKLIGKEMNKETLLCPIDNFLGWYGPRPGITEQDVKMCKEHLIAGEHIVKFKGKLVWGHFAQAPSTYKDLNEKTVFEDVKEIVDSINAYARGPNGKHANPYHLEMVPDQHLSAESWLADHRMDGALVDQQYKKQTKLPVRFIYVPHEYKKTRSKKDHVDVSSSNLHHQRVS